jgi:hypothetical protein
MADDRSDGNRGGNKQQQNLVVADVQKPAQIRTAIDLRWIRFIDLQIASAFSCEMETSL